MRVLLINAIGQGAIWVGMMAVNAAIWSQVIAAVLTITAFIMLYVFFGVLAVVRPSLLMAHQVTAPGEEVTEDDEEEQVH